MKSTEIKVDTTKYEKYDSQDAVATRRSTDAGWMKSGVFSIPELTTESKYSEALETIFSFDSRTRKDGKVVKYNMVVVVDETTQETFWTEVHRLRSFIGRPSLKLTEFEKKIAKICEGEYTDLDIVVALNGLKFQTKESDVHSHNGREWYRLHSAE